MLGVPMMLPAVVPWELGPVIPVGMLPATTVHCTGVGVAPLLNVVLHPVVSKLKTPGWSTASVAGSAGVITHEPDGGAGFCETGSTDGVQPGSVTVAVGVRRSDTVTRQSGAVK